MYNVFVCVWVYVYVHLENVYYVCVCVLYIVCVRVCVCELLFLSRVFKSLANWDGISDPESGIFSYGWCIGTSVGSCNVMSFTDPFPNFVNRHELWTDMAAALFQTALQDGTYYVSVQAINNVVYGGAMATIIEHSTPYVIDTSPPLVQLLTSGLGYNASLNQLSLTYLAK